ncbi:MAG: hypothetical protein JWM80_6696 [Cyanobacteria bacterium RYN_339]|nr:hypothetical protein [Cyanobacteria bacterium RYN_339]
MPIAAWVAATVIALGQPPRARPPAHGGGYNVARGKLVYASPHTFWAPLQRGEPQAGLQRLTNGVFAGRAGVVSRETVVLAPYTADLAEIVLPEPERQRMPRGTCYLEVDLGGVFQIDALALEADAAGDYRLEGSREGRFWHSLWTAPAAFGQHGFVIRRSGQLVHPADIRYVRVSGAAGYGLGDRPETFPGEARRLLYAASELEAYTSQALPHENRILQ